jgi:uncharacterized protein YabE (DUF348 family)/3D (Asp-Asp-Asp) domain-containing protein
VLVLAVAVFRLFPTNVVTVVQDGQSSRVPATFPDQTEALSAASVQLNPGDTVIEGVGGRYRTLAVTRARDISIAADGQRLVVRTQAQTVAGALAAAAVVLRPGDRVLLNGKVTTARGQLRSGTLVTRPGASLSAVESPIYDIVVQRSRPVSVLLDGMRMDTVSAASTVGDVLADLGITVREGDLVRPGLSEPVAAGSAIRLATGRTVLVKLDGRDLTLYTLARNVGEVLAVLGVTMGPEDTVFPSLATPLTPGLQVTIATTRVVEEDHEELIEPPVRDQFDASSFSGDITVREGTPGTRLVRYRLTLRNGVEDLSRRETVESRTMTEPVPTTRIIGTRPRPGNSKPTINVPGGGPPLVYSRKMTVWATWYNLQHGAFPADSPHYGTTASGRKATWGTCAVDTSVIPFYTRFYVPGYGWCEALDTGSGVTGNHIDLFFPDEVGDPGWGAKTVEIYIVD